MSLLEFPPFVPHRLLRGGHAQTVAAVYLPGSRFDYQATPHFVELDDGDQIVLHEDRPEQWQPGGPVTLLVHGLGGCHGSPYMVRIASKLRAAGVRVFRMDLRGWGAGTQIAQNAFHAGRTGDIAASIAKIQQLVPESKIALVGFSLGANMVLKLLSEVGEGTREQLAVDRALAVAPPIDLMSCCRHLSSRVGRIYDREYTRFMWKHLLSRVDVVPDFAAAARKQRPRGMLDFDVRFTAPMGGFDSVEQYYGSASSKSHLHKITAPTTILIADDDPIVPARLFDDLQLAGSVAIHRTAAARNIGYNPARNGEPDRRWLDWRVVEFATL